MRVRVIERLSLYARSDAKEPHPLGVRKRSIEERSNGALMRVQTSILGKFVQVLPVKRVGV